MLKAHSRFVITIFFICDVLVVAANWMLGYFLCFLCKPPILSFPAPLYKDHLLFLFPVMLIYALVFNLLGLYESKRTAGLLNELKDIVKGASLSIAVISLVVYYGGGYHYSGAALLAFWAAAIITLSGCRILLRTGLRILRSKGYNLRHILIVGTGNLAGEVAKKIHQHREFGLEITGFLAMRAEQIGRKIGTGRVIGEYKDIARIVAEQGIDQVVFALSQREQPVLNNLLQDIAGTMIDVSIIPDLRYNFFTLRRGVEDFAGLPVLKLREAPLYGWNNILKRCFDVAFAVIALILSAPLMLLAAIAVKLESPGALFYTQERMGCDGRVFPIIKFRSMREDAETESGAVWAKENDPRRTRIGKILRKASIDELPQLLNVLKGEMSLVGPRPERPVLIEQFRRNLAPYMLRHKMKAGITGWAQVHGLRGDTSLEKRIEYDLYYIEHWSLWLDMKILLLTIPAMFKGA